jgi:hypothetical protein
MQGEKQQILPSKLKNKNTLFKDFFSMVDGSPWIWNVKE